MFLLVINVIVLWGESAAEAIRPCSASWSIHPFLMGTRLLYGNKFGRWSGLLLADQKIMQPRLRWYFYDFTG